ncbi:glycosyltransferase family 9 protein [Hymenobacter sp. ASUV-10]|uniref:Glycosyltransferase family 9 protein n=1 Tax=Hymenobacter aranciens TaxID=3063996 RepID=A0ABT9BAM9_9BACT|nr:glycosyltransferase family 9 protein [Hymenobacter sp. ASUV-10]MDO7875329.1 glycosyltransferase family 9 protein [Hymenobacter sp. ASUV-10]
MSATYLVSRTDAIGDVVLTLPVCGWLKQQFPDCRVVLIGRSYTAAVAAACPWVDDFLNLDELQTLPEPAQVAVLRRYEAAAIIHVFPNKLLARLAQKARIPLRIGTRNRWQHWLTCNRLVALSRRHSPLHEAQLNLQLLRPLGFVGEMSLAEIAPLVKLQPTEPLAEPWQGMLDARRPGQLNIILHPRSRGSAREWGLENFARLAQQLHSAGHRVFITGTAAEGEELAPWLKAYSYFITDNLTGLLSLPQFLAFIAAADGLVAGSTGPLHLAAALGRHALGLYPPIRPMHPGRWAPLGAHAEYMVFDKPDCEDCRTAPASCTCIRAIEPLAVLARLASWAALPPLAAS